ncbi:hypothetical protein N0V90_004569 [Kalmusia sp. IMI 367209]|nr:hypothetical protein N0V90_004569 [Kalmusia sp. IMI 367209]
MYDLSSHDAFEDASFDALFLALAEAPSLIPLDYRRAPNAESSSYSSTCSASPSTTCPITPAIPPKQGGRFSKNAIRVLKTWLNAHGSSPYPKSEDLQFLQEQTGLDRKQITNWFANARRRDQVHGIRSGSMPIRIKAADSASKIARPGTPAVQQRAPHKNPLQRWVESPPENEPAAVSDITRAVATGWDGFLQTFKTKYDWQRHEKTLHLSLDQWICAPDGPRVPVADNSEDICCVFCGKSSPDDVHVEAHQYSACQARNFGERTFHRKDHLIQHLRLVHKADYLIHFERSTPFPMRASNAPTATPINAYELLKLEINYYQQKWLDQYGQLPSSRSIHLEACRIIFAAEALAEEVLSVTQRHRCDSWLRDLVMSSLEVLQESRFGPIRFVADGVSTLKINGQDQLFERCPFEAQLRTFVDIGKLIRLGLLDCELQREACEIIRRVEKDSNSTLEGFAGCAIRLIEGSTDWLSAFKIRAGISIESQVELIPTPQLLPVPFAHFQTATSLPSDLSVPETVQIQHPATSPSGNTFTSMHPSNTPPIRLGIDDRFRFGHSAIDSNFFRLLVSDLRRWTLATMSPHNPDRHVPSDEEIQHHARWIVYESDDPWNQTAADHAEWLWQFKKDVGIIQNTAVSESTGVFNLW